MLSAPDRHAPGTARDERQGWLFCVSGADNIHLRRGPSSNQLAARTRYFFGGLARNTSISTCMPGAASAATCTVERDGRFGCSFVPKYWL